jgi:hypothetical protein
MMCARCSNPRVLNSHGLLSGPRLFAFWVVLVRVQKHGEILYHCSATALTEKMMRQSGLVLSKANVVLPESPIDAYRKREEQKKHEVVKVPIQKQS